MATNFSPCFCLDEEDDYIDMDFSLSSTNFLYCSSNSAPSTDFEFQMPSISNDKEAITSSADELFYEGQLLPLYRQLQLKMEQQNLLETSSLLSSTTTTFETAKQAFKVNNHQTTPIHTLSTNTTSPLESRKVSSELKPDVHFLEWSAELNSFINKQHPKDSWSKKMSLIKQSTLMQKLKASRAYLKSLLSKSPCKFEAGNLSKFEAASDDEFIKIIKQKPCGNIGKYTSPTIATIMKSIDKEGTGTRRRSFSGAIKRYSATKCSSSSSSSSICSSGASSSSSSSSFNSSGFHELHLLKRSNSATEIERSVEAAIAHCKRSQQISESRNNTSRLDFAPCKQERWGVSL